MLVGLVMSYSRGAWLATAVGFLYLAKAYGKFKWRHVILGAGVLALGSWLFWGQTPDNAPWYLKRMDFGRPSSQHRVAAWRGAIQIMWDHPFGVGWNKAIGVYEKNYSPPEGGASAITMNSYLMLGTELGLPALLCFVAYVGLCLKSKAEVGVQRIESHEDARPDQKADACATLELDIGHWRRRPVAPEPLFCWWHFGLTADCSRWPRRRCFGFCWNWERSGKLIVDRPKDERTKRTI